MPGFAEFVTQLMNGLVLGLLYALIALGFMLILGVMQVVNFSHGVLFAWGAYFAFTLRSPVTTPAGSPTRRRLSKKRSRACHRCFFWTS